LKSSKSIAAVSVVVDTVGSFCWTMVGGTTHAAGEGAGADVGAAVGAVLDADSTLLFDLCFRVFVFPFFDMDS
jgi:hypothetical protein